MNEGNQIIHVPRRFVAHEWGGTETVVLEISKQQLAAGWRPHIITSMALSDRRHDQIAGIPITRFPHLYPFFGLSGQDKAALDKKGGNLLSLSLLMGLLREKQVRIFHAHSLKRLGGTVRTAARLRGIPYVVTLHGGVFDVPSEELASLQDPVRGKLEWGKPFGALLGSRRVLEDADHVICVGKTEAKMAAAQLNHDRISHLPNGVDCHKFMTGDGRRFRQLHHIPESAVLMTHISRIDPQKNQRCLLDAFVSIAAEHPQTHLMFIGPETHAGYAESLRQQVIAHQLGSRVTILPGIANDDPMLVNAYHAADLFVLPSRHEPFGIAVLEAWCAGKPVIASRVGGLASLVTDEVNGLQFDPAADDATLQLRQQMLRLLANPSMRTALGDAGRKEAMAHYDWAKVGDTLEGIYQQAILHHRKSRNR